MRRDGNGLVLLAWAGTRVPLILMALAVMPYPRISWDVVLYERWSRVLREGHFPVHDVYWQYPPGAALVMLAPGKLPGSYFTGFVAASVLADLVVCGLLLWMGRRQPARDSSGAGAWVWVLAVPALGYVAWLAVAGGAKFGHVSAGHTALMVFSGVATAIPLLLFAGAANRVPMVGIGILQYVAPILQLACGVLIYHEPMPAARLAGFGLVWIALVIFTVDAVRAARRRTEADPTAATAESATAIPSR